MPKQFSLSQAEINKLLANPNKPMLGRTANDVFTAEIIDHYGTKGDGQDREFAQFGLKISFNKATELEVYDKDFTLDTNIKKLIETFGLIIFENAYFSEKQRKDGQKNIFPSLAFHVDRGAKFENQYSIFVRDPFDEEQKHPRNSGTLILSNQVAKLQGQNEGIGTMDMGSRYDLFTKS